ncbi:MAG: DUF1684 domain-containing protein [Gammaproteobacteria bacterium]
MPWRRRVVTKGDAMTPAQEKCWLAHWRSAVAALYHAVRTAPEHCAAASAARFRTERDALFRSHPSTPLAEGAQRAFQGLSYYGYRAHWRVVGRIEPDPAGTALEIALGEDGVLRAHSIGRVRFSVCGQAAALTLYWIDGYGGGLWLPFGDATNGEETYGGGRYLYDTIKGADLGVDGTRINLDFNYAYNLHALTTRAGFAH